MNCPRCNTELPDTATYCVQCGAPSRPASFSYLPAGTPPWPTSAPKNFPYMQETNMQPVPSTYIEGTVSQVKTAAPKKSSLSFPVIIGLFLLSILIGGGVTLGILAANGTQLFGTPPAPPAVRLPTPSASSTPGATSTAQGNQLPTPTSFQSITMTDLGVSMKYPSDWQKSGPTTTQSNDLEVRLIPSQQLNIAFLITRISASNSASIANPNAANQGILQAFSQLQGVTNLTATTTAQPTIGGVQWNEQDATFTGPSTTGTNTIQYDFVTVAVQHNKMYYVIFFYSPDSYYKEAIQKYFQPMLNSYKFLS